MASSPLENEHFPYPHPFNLKFESVPLLPNFSRDSHPTYRQFITGAT